MTVSRNMIGVGFGTKLQGPPPKAIISRKIHLSDKTIPFLVGQTTKSSQKLAMGVN